MTCDAEAVTGYVDEALDEARRAEVEAHLASCPACAGQLQAERALRSRLAELPPPALSEITAARLRRRIPRQRPRLMRFLAPLAAALLLGLWVRGMAPVVAWEVARDHDACFSHAQLPAQVWSHRVDEVSAWFEERGVRLPLVPEVVGGIRLAGARFCPLPGGNQAPHLYYVSAEEQVSLFVVDRSIRFDSPYATQSRGHAVRLLGVAGTVVGLVGESDAQVDAFAERFERILASRLRDPDPAG